MCSVPGGATRAYCFDELDFAVELEIHRDRASILGISAGYKISGIHYSLARESLRFCTIYSTRSQVSCKRYNVSLALSYLNYY